MGDVTEPEPATSNAWPWRRRWTLAKWAIGLVLGAAIALGCFATLVTPLLIWTNLAGTPVTVQGTEVSYHGRHDKDCHGWVLPSGATVPVKLFDGYHELAHLSPEERAQIRRVNVADSGHCADGQFWSRHSGDDVVWARPPSGSALLNALFKSSLALTALTFSVRSARKCAGIVRGDPLAWDDNHHQAAHGSRNTLSPAARRAEPHLLRGVLSLLIVAGIFVILFVTFAVVVALSSVSHVAFLADMAPILALIAVVALAVGLVRANKRLSRIHRDRIRRRGTALRGTIVQCRESTRRRPRSSAVDYWVTLTVEFSDPERQSPQWIKRAYRFTSSEHAEAADFAHRYSLGHEATVYRGAHKVWYVLDVDDSHLSWPQWW